LEYLPTEQKSSLFFIGLAKRLVLKLIVELAIDGFPYGEFKHNQSSWSFSN